MIARESWVRFDCSAFSGLCRFAKVAMPNVAILFVDWTAFEVITVLASYLSVHELGTTVVLMSIFAIGETIPKGIFESATANIGNLLGEGRPRSAIFFAKASVILSIVFGLLFAAINYALKDIIAYIYTRDH